MNNEIKDIVILGGGTAGWIAANLMAVKWEGQGFNITLVESPDIGIIGVGEGSTPPLRTFFETIGVSEEEWMRECDATYKVGIAFHNWSTKPGFTSYFHPFFSQLDHYTVPAFFHNNRLRRKGVEIDGHPDPFFLAKELAAQRLAPITPPEFPFDMQYAYHFNSGMLGQFLQRVAERRGVSYQQATVNDVVLDEQGCIDHLKTAEGEDIHADFFVDSTGFRSQLMQKALEVPFVSYADTLFNDSAVVLATDPEENPAPQTTSTALKYGWVWKIPLTSRFGNGYVYSSKYVESDAAETEFREHLGLLEADVEARHLKFNVGRVQQHWAKNCVAVGLSQGFVEPLEATALDMVQLTVARFIEYFDKGDRTDKYRDEFNDFVSARFDAVKDYIVCHYKINSRSDTEYWVDNRNNEKISRALREILSSWRSGKELTDDLQRLQLDAYFPDASWHCLLTGKGMFPPQERLKPGDDAAYRYDMADIEKYVKGCALNFPAHKDQLELIRQ